MPLRHPVGDTVFKSMRLIACDLTKGMVKFRGMKRNQEERLTRESPVCYEEKEEPWKTSEESARSKKG